MGATGDRDNASLEGRSLGEMEARGLYGLRRGSVPDQQDSSMKVLALVTDAFGGYGGIAQYNRDFLSALADAPGVETVYVIPRLAPDPFASLPNRVSQSLPFQSRIDYGLAALKATRRLKPDLIFCGHLYHGPLAALLARIAKTKLVSQLHGTEVWKPLRRRDLYPLLVSDLVLTVSRDTLRRFKDQASGTQDNGAILANTVQDIFTPGNRLAARARFGLAHETLLLSVGRLDTREGYKGHDRVIHALPSLVAKRPDLVYWIAGIGNDRHRLEMLAHDLGVDRNVRFLGKVSLANLPDLYRAADLFVLPSTGEGFGIVYLEAMACGTPALGLNVGGAPDALGDGALGWCVAETDFPEALSRAIEAPRPDAFALATAVQQRFGRDVFRARVASLLGTLQ